MERPLYNQLVPYYELVEGRDWRGEVDLITSILRRHNSKSIVDLGCGTGHHVRALAKLGFRATGIDISNPSIRFARRKAKEENAEATFLVGSYYDYRPSELFDAALCLNWSIPVRDDAVRRFLDNTNALLRPGGLLIFDFERVSQICWADVGKPITESWSLPDKVIVRVSVGRILSNILYSRDVYVIYPKLSKASIPNEQSRYQASRTKQVQLYIDNSCVRFFSMPEIRIIAKRSGFRIIDSHFLRRHKYKRNYVALRKTG
jgi:SAM-dependent methyltransferase